MAPYMTKTLIAVFLLHSVFSEVSLAQSLFCPRLEGTNLQCDSSTSQPPSNGQTCTIQQTAIKCFQCNNSTTVTVATFSNSCQSWTCQVITSPEGLPRKSAQCTNRVTCCTESQQSCCTDYSLLDGTSTRQKDCSVVDDCPSGSTPYQPTLCSGLDRNSCNGAPSCTGDAPIPSDCN